MGPKSLKGSLSSGIVNGVVLGITSFGIGEGGKVGPNGKGFVGGSISLPWRN